MSGAQLIAVARAQGRTALDELAGKQLLASFDVTVPKSVVVPDAGAVAGAIAPVLPVFIQGAMLERKKPSQSAALSR